MITPTSHLTNAQERPLSKPSDNGFAFWRRISKADLLHLFIGVAVVFVVMVLPLWWISDYRAELLLGAAGVTGGAAVGIGAIFRSVSRDVLRTSVGIASRTAARTVSRHWTHLVVRLGYSLVGHPAPVQNDGTPHPVIALVTGCLAAALSYIAVIMLLNETAQQRLLGDIPLWAAGLTVTVPLLAYYLIAFIAGRALKVRVTPRTEIDGLILQLYFTLAIAFLPLTSDGAYRGTAKRKAAVATITLTSLLLLYCLLVVVGTVFDSSLLVHGGNLFLVYAFVLAFPFNPLDGSHVWRINKLIWLAIWLPIAAVFHFNIPEAFYEFM